MKSCFFAYLIERYKNILDLIFYPVGSTLLSVAFSDKIVVLSDSPIKANHSKEWDPRWFLTKPNRGAPLLSFAKAKRAGAKLRIPPSCFRKKAGGTAGLPKEGDSMDR